MYVLGVFGQHFIGLYQILAPDPANPESGHYLEVPPGLAPAKFLARFTKFRQKLTNNDVTKKALNCTASLSQAAR